MNFKTKCCADLLKHKVNQTKNFKKSKLKKVKCKSNRTNLSKIENNQAIYLCTKKTQKRIRKNKA